MCAGFVARVASRWRATSFGAGRNLVNQDGSISDSTPLTDALKPYSHSSPFDFEPPCVSRMGKNAKKKPKQSKRKRKEMDEQKLRKGRDELANGPEEQPLG